MVTLFGKLFQIVNGPGTVPNGTFALRSAPPWAGKSGDQLVSALSTPQLEAIVSMASWAEDNLSGVTGTTTLNGEEIPEAAMKMREAWKGASFGGMSQTELRQRRKAKRTSVGEIRSAAQANRGITSFNPQSGGPGA